MKMEPEQMNADEGDPDAARVEGRTVALEPDRCVACGSRFHGVEFCPQLGDYEIALHNRRVALARLAGFPVRQSLGEQWRSWRWKLRNRRRAVFGRNAMAPVDVRFDHGPARYRCAVHAEGSRPCGVVGVLGVGLAFLAAIVAAVRRLIWLSAIWMFFPTRGQHQESMHRIVLERDRRVLLARQPHVVVMPRGTWV